MNQPVHIDINETEYTKNIAGLPLRFTKATFFNRGNIPVYVGKIPVVPGASYQVNYEHPNTIVQKFDIRFDTTATPASPTMRAFYALDNEPKLIIQTMTPKL